MRLIIITILLTVPVLLLSGQEPAKARKTGNLAPNGDFSEWVSRQGGKDTPRLPDGKIPSRWYVTMEKGEGAVLGMDEMLRDKGRPNRDRKCVVLENTRAGD